MRTDPLPFAERLAALEWIRETLGIDTTRDSDPLISIPQIASMAGVQKTTVTMWLQRSRPDYTGTGKLKVPFPTKADGRYVDRPQWHSISQVLGWLWKTERWPRGAAARPMTRGPRSRAA
jgi:hypothetical protein